MKFLKNTHLYALLFFSYSGCTIPSPSEGSFKFEYEYKLSKVASFDKNLLASIGEIIVSNSEKKNKRFRYSYHSPHLYWYDKNKKKCYNLFLVLNNPESETNDPVIWAILTGSTTSYYPMPFNKTRSFTAHINLRLVPRTLDNIKKSNPNNIEFHFFNPGDAITYKASKSQDGCPLRKPDFIIPSIEFSN